MQLQMSNEARFGLTAENNSLASQLEESHSQREGL